MSAQPTVVPVKSTSRGAKAKAALRQRGGAFTSVSLQPESVAAAAFLVSSGWAPSRDAAINRAVQALADAQRLVFPSQPSKDDR